MRRLLGALGGWEAGGVRMGAVEGGGERATGGVSRIESCRGNTYLLFFVCFSKKKKKSKGNRRCHEVPLASAACRNESIDVSTYSTLHFDQYSHLSIHFNIFGLRPIIRKQIWNLKINPLMYNIRDLRLNQRPAICLKIVVHTDRQTESILECTLRDLSNDIPYNSWQQGKHFFFFFEWLYFQKNFF